MSRRVAKPVSSFSDPRRVAAPASRPFRARLAALAWLGVSLLVGPAAAQQLDEEGGWLAWADPADAGFDAEALEAVRQQWEASDSAAFLVIQDGAALVSWGDVERRYMCHSVRKSFLSALFGFPVEDGTLDTEWTLAELGIDEPDRPLTDVESRARISDLLKARSGIYMTAAYEPPENPKPPRGSHAPGTNWCYNNWDFNTLVTIFMQLTGEDVFEAFDRRLAAPLGMQDWRVSDGYLHHQPDMSAHPAYPFRMSGRDMARFGQLFLEEGRWQGEPVLSANWVRRSRVSYSHGTWMGGYGLMWWVFEDNALAPYETYAALGVGQQMIAVLPTEDMVIVNRTDTFTRDRPSFTEISELMVGVVEARRGPAREDAVLVPLAAGDFTRATDSAVTFDADELAAWAGRFPAPPPSLGLEADGQVDVSVEGGALAVHEPRSGTYRWYPQADGSLLSEDSLRRALAWSADDDPARPGEVPEGFVRWDQLVDAGYTRWTAGDHEGAERLLSVVPLHFSGRPATAGSAVLVALLRGEPLDAVALDPTVPAEAIAAWLDAVAAGLTDAGSLDGRRVADARRELFGAG